MSFDTSKDLNTADTGGLEIPLRYFYAAPDYWDKYLAACQHLMWLKSTFLSQTCNSFMAVHWKYYADCADLDAAARGLSSEAFFDICLNWDAELPAYMGNRPTFKPSPLHNVPDVETTPDNRRRVKVIRTSQVNGALLRVACVVDRCNLITITSRLLRWHFDQYWEKSYAPQIRAAHAKSFRRLFEK